MVEEFNQILSKGISVVFYCFINGFSRVMLYRCSLCFRYVLFFSVFLRVVIVPCFSWSSSSQPARWLKKGPGVRWCIYSWDMFSLYVVFIFCCFRLFPVFLVFFLLILLPCCRVLFLLCFPLIVMSSSNQKQSRFPGVS